MGPFDLRNILHLPSPPPLGMQLIPETPDAAPGETTADPTLSGSWDKTSAQSKRQALAGGTAFGHSSLQLSRL